jgi:endonuclease-3 related protein
MPRFDESYPELVAALAAHYGPPPARGGPAGEAVFRAYLDLRLGPRRCDAALDALRDAGLLEPGNLADSDPLEVRDTFGLQNIPVTPKDARILRHLAHWLARHDTGGPLDEVATESLREELRSLQGVGQATADAVLLYGLGRLAYPVDRASFRILVRHGWLDAWADYDEARALIERREPEDPGDLVRLAYWFDRVGVEACRPATAHCERCPLRPWLPEGGPAGPEAHALDS